MNKIDQDNQELVNQFFKLINYMGNEDALAKAFSDKLVREHRTLQQNAIRFISKVVETYAENHTGHDLRNEASVQWAENVARHHPGAFPFV
jgi:hypothetical protein